MLTYLIPTAKEMKIPQTTFPHKLSSKSSAISQQISQLSVKELASAYNISPVAAEKEYGRWQHIQSGAAIAYPAAQLFNGLMYRHLDRQLLTEQSPIYITSSFYGIIQALEPIAEHRLDFYTKVKIYGLSLKAFWRPDYDAFASQQNTIVSLLSSEFTEVFSPEVREKFVSITFMEEKYGKLKVHSTISKKARGAFLTQALKTQPQTLDDLKKLTFDDFSYSAQLSTEKQLVFIKSA